jgi:hypothetical protein
VLVLGLAVAVTSPVSVVTVIVMLGMPHGRRRAFAFVAGWVLGILVLGIITITVLHGQDFSSKQTTPSRAASAVEAAIGLLLVAWGAVKLRRRDTRVKAASPPTWLDKLGQTNWLIGVVVGAVMLTYSITIAACAEILKANVSAADTAIALAVFALASMATILAPLVYVIVRPERSDAALARGKSWLLASSGTVGLVVLIVIGALIAAKGIVDLVRGS